MWKRLLSIIYLIFFVSLLVGYTNLHAQVRADFSASNVSGCSPITVNFSNQSTGAASWQWDLGNGTVSTLKDPSATYITPGTYTVKLTATNGNSTDVITKTNFITVYASPSVGFSTGATSGCYPLSVPFTDQSAAGSGNIISWQWDFGDGNVSSEQNPTHIYNSAGQFNVILTVKNSNGCTKTITKQNLINISNGVIANFDNYIEAACLVPASIGFINSSSGTNITGYVWDFGDGQTSTAFSPTHVYTTAGSYTVSLTATNAVGCVNKITLQNKVDVGTVKADFNYLATVCADVKLNLTNTSSLLASLQHSFWDFGDGTTDTLKNPKKTYSVPGTYSITLKSDYGACSDVVTKKVTVLPKASPIITASVTSNCVPPLTTTFTNLSSNLTVITWDFGDGTTSKLANPTHTYTTAGDYTVKLTASNSNGCIGSTIMPSFIHIGAPKVTAINGPPYKGCVPYNASFSAIVSPATMPVTYAWDFGDGTTSTQANPVHNYTSEGSYNVRVKVSAIDGGCSDTFTLPNAVVVGTKPQAAFTATPLIVCAGESVYFTDQTSGGDNEYLWFFGDNGSSAIKNPVHVYKDTGYSSVTFVAIRNGCADTITKINYIYVNKSLVPAFDSFLCSNQYQHFFSSSTVNTSYQFNWNFGDGATSTIVNPTHIYSDTGHYQVQLSINGANNAGCSVSKIDVYVLKQNADFVIADSTVCGSMFKKFSAAVVSPYQISSTWDFGDGGYAIDSTHSFISHNYATKGTYNVKLTVLDSNKCAASISKPVTVNKFGPKADFSVPKLLCKNSLINFTDLSTSVGSGITQWTWNFGDTTKPTVFSAPPFTHIYKQNDVYDVQLIVKDAAGCSDTASQAETLEIRGPNALIVIEDTVQCLNTMVTFYNYSSGDDFTSYWEFGDGTSSSLYYLGHTYTQPGYYNVLLAVKDKYGCSDTTVLPYPIHAVNALASFSMSDSTSNCPPLLVTFANTSTNARNVVWDFGDGNTSTVANPSHTYTLPGTFKVKLAITGKGGCTDSSEHEVVIAGPVGTLTYNPILGCTPLNVSFVNSTAHASYYTWDFDDGVATRNTSKTEKHTYARLGTYLPKIILEDSVGCKVPIYGLDSIRVKGVEAHIKQLPIYLICDSGQVAFKDSAITNDTIRSYAWAFGDGSTSSQQNPVHKYATSGNYVANYIITTVAGCNSSDTLKVPIKVVPAPNIAFNIPASACVPANVKFSGQWLNQDTSNLSWKWDLGNGNTANSQYPPSQTYSLPGNYTISSIAINGSGCTDTVVHVLPVFALPIVNAGPDKFICLGKSSKLNATGALSYTWQNQSSLSCLECADPIANPKITQLYTVAGTDLHGCMAEDSVIIKVKQPFTMVVEKSDTLCFGQSYMLNATGAERYIWSPATFLSNPIIANPIAKPDSSITYKIIGYDTLGCFADTGFITIKIYPIPKVDIIEEKVTVTAGSTLQLHSNISGDVTKMHWSPALGLSCVNCQNPIASPKEDVTYTLTVTNGGGCTAKDNVDLLVVCGQGNIYIPNTFSPNNDGVNDVFYPRGRGIYGIKGMRVFSRWGEMIFEKTNFQANDLSSGWDGSFNGKKLTTDVYVYIIDVICENNKIFTLKGNVTLLK